MAEVRIHPTVARLEAADVALRLYKPNGYDVQRLSGSGSVSAEPRYWPVPFYRQDVDNLDSPYSSPLDPSGWWMTRQQNDDPLDPGITKWAPDGPLVGYISASGEYLQRGWPNHLVPFQHRPDLDAVNQLAQIKLPTNVWEDVSGSGVGLPTIEGTMFAGLSPSGNLHLLAASGILTSENVGDYFSLQGDVAFSSRITGVTGSGITTVDSVTEEMYAYADDFNRADTTGNDWGSDWTTLTAGLPLIGNGAEIVDQRLFASGNTVRRQVCTASGNLADDNVQVKCVFTINAATGGGVSDQAIVGVGASGQLSAAQGWGLAIEKDFIRLQDYDGFGNPVNVVAIAMSPTLDDGLPHNLTFDMETRDDLTDVEYRIMLDGALTASGTEPIGANEIRGLPFAGFQHGFPGDYSMSIDDFRASSGRAWEVSLASAIQTSETTGLVAKDFVEVTDGTTTKLFTVARVATSAPGELVYMNTPIAQIFGAATNLTMRKKVTFTTSPWEDTTESPGLPGMWREQSPYVFPGEDVLAWPINAIRQCFELLELHTHYIRGEYEVVTGVTGFVAAMMIGRWEDDNIWPDPRNPRWVVTALPRVTPQGGEVTTLSVSQHPNPADTRREPYVQFLDAAAILVSTGKDINSLSDEEMNYFINGRQATVKNAPYVRTVKKQTIPPALPQFKPAIGESLVSAIARWNSNYPDYQLEYDESLLQKTWPWHYGQRANASTSGLAIYMGGRNWTNWYWWGLGAKFYKKKHDPGFRSDVISEWVWGEFENGQDPVAVEDFSTLTGMQDCLPPSFAETGFPSNAWSGAVGVTLNDGIANKTLSRLNPGVDRVAIQHINQLRDAIEVYEGHTHQVDLELVILTTLGNQPQVRKLTVETGPPEFEIGYGKPSQAYAGGRLTSDSEIEALHVNEMAAGVMWLYDHRHNLTIRYDDIIKSD